MGDCVHWLHLTDKSCKKKFYQAGTVHVSLELGRQVRLMRPHTLNVEL